MSSRANPQLSELLAEVNARISEYAAGTDVGSQIWLFHCECGVDGCEERVSMTVAEYEQLKLRDLHAPVLAEGHRVLHSARMRAWARSLREDAQALRAQARHQMSRAARLRRRR